MINLLFDHGLGVINFSKDGNRFLLASQKPGHLFATCSATIRRTLCAKEFRVNELEVYKKAETDQMKLMLDQVKLEQRNIPLHKYSVYLISKIAKIIAIQINLADKVDDPGIVMIDEFWHFVGKDLILFPEFNLGND